MAVPAIGALALGAGAIVASVGSLVLPFYAGYKLHKRLERRRSAKRRRRAREAMWRKLEDMRWRGCCLLGRSLATSSDQSVNHVDY